RMVVPGYPGETVRSIELTYEISSSKWDDLRVDLAAPGATGAVTIRAPGPVLPGVNTGDFLVQATIPATATDATATLLNGATDGTWMLTATDLNNGGGDSQLKGAWLTLHTTGGPDKLARTSSWISAPIDATTEAFAVDAVTWTARVPAGATVAVQVGTCQQSDCRDVQWSDPVTSGQPVAISRARYLQIRVDMTSNGALEPELSGLSLQYRRDAP
ncbi:MAG TPA: hypothetical protein VFT22_00785, partial [Kofleriaceae bacterium]|nr:hypothetical protein [Kofleriaceae bacterium]